MTKIELLQRILQSRSELQRLFQDLPEERMEEIPGAPAGWSVKDLVAHITYWEWPTLDRYSGKIQAKTWGDVNAMNDELLERSRRSAVADILQEFEKSGKELLEQIGAISEEQLQQESPWKDGKSLEHHVADDTWVHYEHHLKTLRDWRLNQG